MDCQNYDNCGGFCETGIEREYALCESCLLEYVENEAFAEQCFALMSEARKCVNVIDAVRAEGDNGTGAFRDSMEWAEDVVHRLADLGRDGQCSTSPV